MGDAFDVAEGVVEDVVARQHAIVGGQVADRPLVVRQVPADRPAGGLLGENLIDRRPVQVTHVKRRGDEDNVASCFLEPMIRTSCGEHYPPPAGVRKSWAIALNSLRATVDPTLAF